MSETMTATPVVVGPEGGEAYWWTGELATIKLTAADTGGALGLVEVLGPPGLEIPPHVHEREDETFWILEGAAEFVVDGEPIAATAGSAVFAPRGVPHAYTIGPAGARMLFWFTPGGFEGFVRDAGEPAPARTLPPPPEEPLDLGRLEELAARYGVELVGP